MTDLSAEDLKAQVRELRRRGQVGRIHEVEARLKDRVTRDLQDFVNERKAAKCGQS